MEWSMLVSFIVRVVDEGKESDAYSSKSTKGVDNCFCLLVDTLMTHTCAPNRLSALQGVDLRAQDIIVL